MKTLHKGMQLSLQNLSPTLPGTLFQPIGAGGFFADDKMSKINIYTPNSNSEDSTKFYPYFFNVNVGTNTAVSKNKTINLDIQVVDPADETHVSVLRGSFTGSFKTVSGESSNIKGQAEVFLADESVVDFLGVCAGLQSSDGNYGIVVYIRGGLTVTGFSNANRVQACGANVGTVDFAGISYPIEIDAIPDNVLNRRNIMNFIASGAYSTTPNMYQVSSTGTSSPLQLGGGGSGNGTPTPLVRSSNAIGADGTFYLMDLRAGGLVYTFPTEPEVGNMIWVGDYADSASILTPLILRSENPIHGEVDDVIITAPSRTMWGYVNDDEGWVCLDGVGEIEESPLPYEEVDILPALNRNANTGSGNCPEGYTWSDFERIEISLGLNTNHRVFGTSVLSKEAIQVRGDGTWYAGLSYSTATAGTRYDLVIIALADGTFTWTGQCSASESGNTAYPYQIKGYTAYRPILERPKRTEVLYKGDLITSGGDVPLSESISKYDMLLIEALHTDGSGAYTYRDTLLISPTQILDKDTYDRLKVLSQYGSTSTYASVSILPGDCTDVSLRVSTSVAGYATAGVSKVTGINWITQNEISDGGGGGKDPHVIKTTNFDIDMNTNIAVDMSDGVSKVASLPIGMLEGQWFKITVIGVTPETNIDGAFITIATPYNQWANNHTWVGFRFPAKTNASYEVQLINGFLTFINESGAGDVFIDAPWDGLPYNRRNGKWVEAAPNKNWFINPHMDFWQETDGVQTEQSSNSYINDGWMRASSVGLSVKETDANGVNWLTLIGSDGGSTGINAWQTIKQRLPPEELLGLIDSDGYLTASFKYKTIGGTNDKIYFQIRKPDALNDYTTVNTIVYLDDDLVTDGTEQKVIFTTKLDIANIVNGLEFIVGGTNSSDTSVVNAANISFTACKLEYAEFSTRCVRESFDEGIRRCQRYYYYQPDYLVGSQSTSNSYIHESFPVPMFRVPDITYNSIIGSITRVTTTFVQALRGNGNVVLDKIRADARL